MSAETHAKLGLAQDLLRHQISDGDPAAIFDRASNREEAMHFARRLRVRLPTPEPVTDLACDPVSGRFAATTAHGVYILDGALERVLRHTVVDPGFSVDMDEFAGAAFLDPNTVLALSRNKSNVILREAERPDPVRNYRFFLESFDQFDEVARSRFTTVRARMMYALSAAFDPGTGSFFTITVPNAKVKRMVVSRFDRRDMTLSEEFAPSLDAASGLSLVANRGCARRWR